MKVVQSVDRNCPDCKVKVTIQKIEMVERDEKGDELLVTKIEILHPDPHCARFLETKKEPVLTGGTEEVPHGFTSPIGDYIRDVMKVPS